MYDALARSRRRRASCCGGWTPSDETETAERPLQLSPAPTCMRASADDADVRADGRRAVQLLDRVRRGARAQGVPQARAGRQPRARDAALPHRARVPEHRAAARLVRVRRRWRCRPRSASRRSSSRTRAAAGSSRWRRSARTRTGSSSGLGSLGTRHRAAAQRARLRRRRPGVLAGGAQPGGAVAADRDRRRGHRADLRAAARRRAPRADRRPRAGRPRAAGGPRPDRDHRPRDPHPRRLSPRPDPVHAARLGDHRLRGRARPGRFPSAARSARRCATWRACCARSRTSLRRQECSAATAAPEDFEQRARETFLEHYFEHVDPTLLPAGEAAISNLLSIYELEKAIYELRYELDNRPDWISIPVAGISRLLEIRMTTVATQELDSLVRREHAEPALRARRAPAERRRRRSARCARRRRAITAQLDDGSTRRARADPSRRRLRGRRRGRRAAAALPARGRLRPAGQRSRSTTRTRSCRRSASSTCT